MGVKGLNGCLYKPYCAGRMQTNFMKICLIFSENLLVFRLKPLNFSIEFLNRPNGDARKFEREHAN